MAFQKSSRIESKFLSSTEGGSPRPMFVASLIKTKCIRYSFIKTKIMGERVMATAWKRRYKRAYKTAM